MSLAGYIDKLVIGDTFRLTTSASTFSFSESMLRVNLSARNDSLTLTSKHFGAPKIQPSARVITDFSQNHSFNNFIQLTATAIRFFRSPISLNFTTGESSQNSSSPSPCSNHLGLNVF
jgi:hypothetical protein